MIISKMKATLQVFFVFLITVFGSTNLYYLQAHSHSNSSQATTPVYFHPEQGEKQLCYEHHTDANNHGDVLYFTENKNQWAKNIRYRAALDAGHLFLEDDKFTYLLLDPTTGEQLHDCKHTKGCIVNDLLFDAHAFEIVFTGANKNALKTGDCPSPSYRNYFIGNDQTKWASNVQSYKEVWYQELYDGIDMLMYSTDAYIKYDFRVAPNANVQQIEMAYNGVEELLIKNGNLHVLNSVNNLVELAPYAYQYINGKETAIACEFKIVENTVNFVFPNGYDATQELVIDPVLVFSTYSGSTADNWGFTATYDNDGHLYAGGAAFGFGYPTTLGAFQTSFAGGNTDISITKFTPDGSGQIYATYIGGGNGSDLPHSLIVAPDGDLVILGTTSSSDYPTTSLAYDTSFNGGDATSASNISFNDGSDIVVTKLNALGNGLSGSTFFGGGKNDGLNEANILNYNYADEARGEVFIDAAGRIYIASCTRSTNLPVSANALQLSLGGEQDGCVARFSSTLNTLQWCTYLGGSDNDAAYSVKIDNSGILYVCGGTSSSNFPTTSGLYSTYRGGSADGFLAKISANGDDLIASTFLGTNQYDQSFFVELDEDNSVYTVGQTEGSYDITPGVYNNSNSGQYIHKLNNNINNTIFSTTFGRNDGDPDISPTAFLVDVCNRIYVSGWGGIINADQPGSTTVGLETTPDAYQSSTDGNDFYFYVLEEDAVGLNYASFFGGDGGEHVDGGTSRFDKTGRIYQAVCAGCGGSNSFPTSAGAWSNTNNASNCNVGSIKFSFDPPLVVAEAVAEPAVIGCAPFTVDFINNSYGATDYLWDFDTNDGTTSNSFEPSFTYDETGVYNVMLIAWDPEACNEADTTYTSISILNPDDVTPEFTYYIDCATFYIDYDAVHFPTEIVDYEWDLGDGASNSGSNGPLHQYEGPGSYEVTLNLSSSLPGCEFSETLTQTVVIPENVVAIPSAASDFGCVPLGVQFQNNSTYATSYEWDFGDGSPISTDTAPSHTFAEPGLYEVILTAINEDSCNGDATDTLSVFALDTVVVADYAYTLPGICEVQNVPFTTNYPTEEYLDFIWDFGDGNTSTEASPTHLYTDGGIYEVSMIVSSQCAPPDTAIYEFTLATPPIVFADILTTPENACAPVSIALRAESNGVTNYWTLDDGTIVDGLNLDYTYETPGTYNIEFTAIDSSTCNISETVSTFVEVYTNATADFDMSTDIAEVSVTNVVFTNQSQFADSYLWDFGDGTTSTEENPQHVFQITGEFEVCLTAQTVNGCNDEVCQSITVIPPIFVGVPNAFSPNNDNNNDELFVAGATGIEYMELRIYNRWGEMVFETTDPKAGWDGTYKKIDQEIEVYVYTLVANLISGRQIKDQGNITLLR